MIRLFVDYPQTKSYFKNLTNISTLEEMQQSAGIRAHGKRVMVALNKILENLNDWAVVTDALSRLAKRHEDVHRVEAYNFELLFLVIMNVFSDALGTDFTAEHCSSWKKLFSIVYDYLCSCYSNSAP
ncbi:cytoglobin-2-like [Bombina bombina]|uniref:cytoglobin-2-like n=1 Tax=Bombina bombina TaxID=8345 RepID=UPI00235B1059|nr:cytoglobin-2-like [Bombina bombina]